ncbi:MAG: T9SS type A sorting domain-containing protein [Bacteroidales bacterium]|nr:T9SS type A sorting domain-containing protein [Bacteroidales bacterium]
MSGSRNAIEINDANDAVIFISGNPTITGTISTGNGIAIRYTGIGGTYDAGTNENLIIQPNTATAVWAIENGVNGISFARGATTGFIAVDGVTVTGALIDLSDASPSVSGAGWTFANNVYTILDGATVTITGTSANQRRIEVATNASNVNITLEDVTIEGLGNDQSPLLLNSGSDVSLVLVGTNTLTAGASSAGIQTTGARLTIMGTGSLVTTGGNGGAGIGGGTRRGAGGTITINGGIITATGGGSTGAGIGGAEDGAGGSVTINGGVVTAIGGLNAPGNVGATARAQGIGKGQGWMQAGTFQMGGNAVVFTNSVGDTDENRRTGGILFVGSETFGIFYGNSVTVTDNVTIPNGYGLFIHNSATLTIPNGITLTNNGTVQYCGTINKGGSFGTWVGNDPIIGLDDNTIDLSVASPILPCDGSWTFTNNVFTISNGTTVTITGEAIGGRSIVVAASASVNIIVEDVVASTLSLGNGAVVDLTIVGENIFTGGIRAPHGTTLTIGGTGSLTAIGGGSNAGIGGGNEQSGGTITINSGTVTATNGRGLGAGIGSGRGVDWGGVRPSTHGGTITINGGTVTAMGFIDGVGVGAGIGGGHSAGGATVTITGGVVTAIGASGQGIGFGGGRGWEHPQGAGTLTISDNAVVFATSVGDTNERRRTDAILVIGTRTYWYGEDEFTPLDEFTLSEDVTVPANFALTVPSGKTLTIPVNRTLTNNGAIRNCGTINNQGTWIGNEPFDANSIDMSLGSPALPCDGSWTFANGIYTILDGASVTITGTNAGQRRIEIAEGANVNITLENATIAGLGNNLSPFLLNSDAEVTLTLVGENTLTAGGNRAGIQTEQGATLTINGTGRLTATGGGNSAGIGGGQNGSGGTVTINSGVVTAIGASNAQGIGRGSGSGDAGTFTMDGNTVVFTNSIGDTAEDRRTSGILVIGNTTHWYGSNEFTLSNDVVVPQNHTLTIDTNKTLIIPESITLTNNGTIRDNWGTIDIVGTFTGNRIVFDNIGNIRDTVRGIATPIDIARLFNIHPKAGAPVYTIETAGTTGTGTLDGTTLAVTEAGIFIIGLATEETEHWAAGARVTSTLMVINEATSITNLETQSPVNVFPNPFTDILHIADAEGFKLQVLTQTGAVVHTQRITTSLEAVNLQHLPAGIYILRLEKDGQIRTARVIKQ